jgi:hypothetical protein
MDIKSPFFKLAGIACPTASARPLSTHAILGCAVAGMAISMVPHGAETFPDAKLLSSPTTDLMEGVPGEKRELKLLMATSAHGTPLAQPGGVDLKIGAREQIECKPLAARLQLSHRPIVHGHPYR